MADTCWIFLVNFSTAVWWWKKKPQEAWTNLRVRMVHLCWPELQRPVARPAVVQWPLQRGTLHGTGGVPRPGEGRPWGWSGGQGRWGRGGGWGEARGPGACGGPAGRPWRGARRAETTLGSCNRMSKLLLRSLPKKNPTRWWQFAESVALTFSADEYAKIKVKVASLVCSMIQFASPTCWAYTSHRGLSAVQKTSKQG